MTHTYTIQRHQPSGELYMLEYDEANEIVAAIPNVNALDSAESIREMLDEIERGDVPATLDQEWHDNAEWARAQHWGYPLTAADVQ